MTDVRVFIGHCHQDRQIARGLRDSLEDWGCAADSTDALLKLSQMPGAYEDGEYDLLLINTELTLLRNGEMEFLINPYKTRSRD